MGSTKKASKTVLLRCSRQRCKFRKMIEPDDAMPEGTVECVEPCEKHEPNGGYAFARYYGKNGKLLREDGAEF